jgi:hypothetical protein
VPTIQRHPDLQMVGTLRFAHPTFSAVIARERNDEAIHSFFVL